MGFVKNRGTKINQESEELNLVPFLDVLIVLIPFLMLTASFFTVVVIEARLPTPIRPETMDRVKFPPPFDLHVQIPKDSIKIFLNNRNPMGPPQFAIVTDTVGEYTAEQLDSFYTILTNIKQQFPTETRVAIDPHPSLPLKRISQLIDRARILKNNDPLIERFPDRALFTSVSMKGVYVP